jgi:MoaA/NifB/PqqE/SkfB family radical SAM enzyme
VEELSLFKVYHEHENFGGYVAFDLAMGKMQSIDKNTFDSFTSARLKFKNEELSPYHTQFPRRAYFQITRSCQLQCDYCYVKAGPKQPHLETDVIFELADYLGQHGLMEVRLTGGEATVHPDFMDICERFFKNNIYISLGTNGLWSNPVKEFLAAQRYFCLAVTIDGSELSHGAYREGSHKALLKNLYELRKNNPYVRIRINMVVTKSNKHHYPELVKMADEIAAESLTFLPLRPRLSNPELLTEVLSAQEYRELMHHARHCYRPNNSTLNLPNSITEIPLDEDTFAAFKKRKVCAAGRERLNFSFDAARQKITTFACSFSPVMDETADARIRAPFIAGEFQYDQIELLKGIWQDDERWDIFRDNALKPQACSSCTSFGKSCGGSGFCHIQNHKYLQLDTKDNVKQQLRAQTATLPDWCQLTHKSIV